MSCAVVLEQEQGRAVVGHGEVHVAIVVDVTEVCRPALLKEHEPTVGGLFGPAALAIVDPELVDAARVLRIAHELAALGDVQVDVAIAVEITEHRPIVAAVVRVGIVAVVVAHQRHQTLVVGGNPSFRPLPHAAEGIVMATKGVEDAVVVEVGHVAGLHEHGSVVEVIQLKAATGADRHEVHPVVAPSSVDVLVPVVVHVANAGAPLVGRADLAVVDFAESRSGLVQDVDVVPLVKNDEVVQAVVVHVNEADGAATVEGIAQQFGGEGKGLCGGCGAENQHGQCKGKVFLVHPWGFAGGSRYTGTGPWALRRS